MAKTMTLPILYGTQQHYNDIGMKDSRTLYICVDTHNTYLGDIPVSKDVLFYEDKNIPNDFGESGQRCITPYGIYVKGEELWSLFSLWEITNDYKLKINNQIIPIFSFATNTTEGVVKGTADDNTDVTAGTVSISDQTGHMQVNGWSKVSQATDIYRVE